MSEYEASLRHLFGEPALDGLRPTLATIPEDHADDEGSFSRQDQRISAEQVNGQFAVADALSQLAVSDADVRMRFASECASVDQACIDAFIPQFLRRALRRVPSADELGRARDMVTELGLSDGLHAVVFTTLMGPDFLFRFENRGELIAEGFAQELTAFELATRLSYHFWGAPPDDELLDAAESGMLDTEAGLREQVDRLFEDERTGATLDQFFAEWLHLQRGDFELGPRLELLRDGIDVDGLTLEMRAEVEELIRFHLQGDGSWRDVLTSRLSFARSDRLAGIYGVEPWDGTSAPPELGAERSGLLTRAGMLYSGDGSTNPFRRGVFVRRTVLCDEVRPPPSNLPADALEPPPLEPGASTRDVYEAKVLDEPCASCHAGFAPLGYALEDFDGLGRYRSEEWVVSNTGDDLGMAAVDAEVVPRVDEEDRRPTDGAVELSARIADSDKANRCLSRQYFRFAYRRMDRVEDTCTVDAWSRALEDGATLAEALRAVALDPTFRQRLLED